MKFKEFFKFRNGLEENQGKSFTYGQCLLDYCKLGYSGNDMEDIEYHLTEYVGQLLGIGFDKASELPRGALYRIPDISVMDDLARFLYFNEYE